MPESNNISTNSQKEEKIETAAYTDDKMVDLEMHTTDISEKSLSNLGNLVEENQRLKFELAVRQEAFDNAVSDIMKKEYESAESSQRDEAKIQGLRQHIAEMSAELAEYGQENLNAVATEQLKCTIQGLKSEIAGFEAALQAQGEAFNSMEAARIRECELGEQREVDYIKTVINGKQEIMDLLIQLNAQMVKSKDLSEQLRESKEQLEAEKTKGEITIQKLQQQLQIQTDEPTDLSQQLEKLKAKHDTELKQERLMTNFFKSNSERLSKKMTDMMELNRVLQAGMALKEKEVEDGKSIIHALRTDLEDLKNQCA
jgi:DNA repair exonuclease SbcCD ATPase subunit